MNAVTEEAALQEPVVIDPKSLNVYQRINEIKKAVKYIEKDKKVESYMAVTHDAVTALTHDHFVRWGVMVEPHEISSVTVLPGMTTARGIPYVRFEAKYRVDFVNIDKPEERAFIEITAHALDHGDKSPGKGVSYATKTAVIKMLQLESGETESGETRPDDIKAPGTKAGLPTKSISGTDGAVEALSPERREVLSRKLSSIVDCFDAAKASGDPAETLRLEQEAFRVCGEVTDTDEKVALWHMLKPHSKMRKRLTVMGDEARAAAGIAPPPRDPALHRRD